MPKVGRGKFDSDLCLAWILDWRNESGLRAKATVAATTTSLDPLVHAADSQDAVELIAPVQSINGETLAEARLRYVQGQAEGQRLRNAILAGSVVQTERVKTAIRARDTDILAAGEEWVSESTTSEERALRRQLNDRYRTRIAGTITAFDADISSGDTVAATRVRNARHVGGS